MEVESSPLAALPAFRHPSYFAFDLAPNSSNNALPGNMFGPAIVAPFGIHVDPIKKKNYFDMEPRGMCSSPTSTLAADLSQNFHIDKTPQVPTPRRSLFQASLFTSRANMTTPPIPSSSPGHDSMDISPLPHKQPYARLPSPRPLSPTDMSMDLSGLDSSPPAPSPGDRRPSLAERKKAGITRPSLLRHNRYSTNGASFKTSGNGPACFSRAATAPQIKLEDLFNASSSPPSDSTMGTPPHGLLAPPRKFPPANNNDGSPVPAASRRSGLQRPRGKVRRTASMFENPQDVLDREGNTQEQAKKNSLSPSPKHSPGEKSILPCFSIKDDPLRRIDKKTLCKVLDGDYAEHYDEHLVVDCRFEYEFNGGHVEGAMNINSTEMLENVFFKAPRTGKVLIIFHCEYSAHRAPRMALHLRSRDRTLNMHRYPALFYPDVYILDGGYSSFYNEHKNRCDPQDYVEMNDASHKRTCEKEMGRFRRATKAGFARAQSFTFGAESSTDNSPSSIFGRRPPNGCGRDTSMNTGSPFPTPTARQRYDPRRMASY